MWPFSKSKSVEPKKVKVSNLAIKVPGETLYNTAADSDGGDIKTSHGVTWKHFLHWYFGRPHSKHYFFKYDGGDFRMIRRCDILGFRCYWSWR